jgi:uncharacterized lipoprotein YehR (DUF1307 family)
MKKIYLILLIVLSLNACQKDALIVELEKIFIQINAPKPTDPMLGTAMNLTLKPGGKADFLPSGDIIHEATYKIKGDKVLVQALNQTFKFTVVSDLELHGENGEILELQ